MCQSQDMPVEAYGSQYRYPAEHGYHGHSPLPLLRRPLMGQPAGRCISCWKRRSRCREWHLSKSERRHGSWRRGWKQQRLFSPCV